jgi:hypothetical protein
LARFAAVAQFPVSAASAFAALTRPWSWAGALMLACALPAQAGRLGVCDPPRDLSLAQKDRLFRFGAIVKAELEQSGQRVALIARSGLDLARFGVRYSHAGFTLKGSAETPWAVRQLYFACEEGLPRLFDQGMLAFVLGMNEPTLGYVSVVLLPPEDAAELERRALDNRQALSLLAPRYSANAFPFSAQYQNCNQWVLELLASARAGLDDGVDQRQRAQSWLKAQGYEPTVFDVGWRPLMWAPLVVPWLHDDDHPAEDLALKRYRVSMPASIEAFVQGTVPGAERLEFCHTDRRVVVRRGWQPIAEGCVPGEHDTVIPLD